MEPTATNEMLAPDPREAKLPQWAQGELRRLRGLVSSLNATLAERSADVEHADSRLFEQRVVGNRVVDVPLSQHSTVGAFLVNKRGVKFRVRFIVREVAGIGTVLDLNADSGILVRPRASSSLYITEDPS